MSGVRIGKACMALALLLCLSAVAFAQGGGGQQGRRGMGRMTLAQIPVSALSMELKLTGDQKAKLTEIQTKYRADVQPLRPTPGSQPDPSNFQKMRDLSQQANQSMEAVLTDDQKAKLPETLRHFSSLRSVGIPLEVYADLKLTDDQKKQIGDISRDATTKMQALAPEDRRTQGRQIRQEVREKTLALLTADQKAIIEKYNREHPRGQGFRRGGNGNDA